MATKKGTTSTTKPTKPTWNKTVDLVAIRGRFDGLKDQIHALPEGKEKTGIMQKIEEVYVETAAAFRGITTSTLNA